MRLRAPIELAPVMIAADAHLDPRFKAFPNLPEDDYASILAVPILARDKLEGALNVPRSPQGRPPVFSLAHRADAANSLRASLFFRFFNNDMFYSDEEIAVLHTQVLHGVPDYAVRVGI